MSRSIKYVYKIWDKNKQMYIWAGKAFADPQSAYNQWAYRYATVSRLFKRQDNAGWHANYEMHKVRVTTTETFVKTMEMKTKKQEKMEQRIADDIGRKENV